MFSATRYAVAGVIVALLGGALLTGALTRPAALPGAATGDAGSFSPTGSLAQPRGLHTATLLPDGRILVVGGGDDGDLASAEVWDPTTASFSPTGSPAEAQGGTATVLPDGRVLFVGDASAEVWEPSGG